MNSMEQRILSALEEKKSLTSRQLIGVLNISKQQRGNFFNTLDTLVADYKILKKAGKFSVVPTADLVPAEIVKINATFGFAAPIEEGKGDVFIPGRFLMGSMPGDKVLLKVSKSSSGDLEEGRVVKITEEENRPFAGTIVDNDRGRLIIEPDRYVRFPLEIDQKSQISVQAGDKVLAHVSRRGDSHYNHRAEITDLFGDGEKASVSARAILAEQGIPSEFPTEVLEEAHRIESSGIHPKEIAARTDLRDDIIFTIDGADTKDIDDAISIKKHANGWTLGVHIADVSYYVLPGSEIDTEAYNRGTSVYYANSVVPMLPTELSNGICSLNPDQDRLAFSAIMDISTDGQLLDYRFEKTLISSMIQGVYSEINLLLDGEASPALKTKYADVMPSLFEMKELAETLSTARHSRGGIHLESVESKIIVDEQGVAVDILPRETGQSEGFIEEFMLMANQSAATFAIQNTLPFLYRVHESPDPDRLDALYVLLDSLGVSYKRSKGETSALALDAILATVKDTNLSGIVNNVMLRTMAKAKYSSENLGHFGLGLKNYSHFTSPIRRYPDLAIHRILTSLVIGMRRDNIETRYGSWVSTTAKHSSLREVAAQTAERDAEDCYKAEYMSQFIGQEFDGIIAAATGFGVFVQLTNTVEGLVSLSNFPEAGEWTFDNLISYKSSVGSRVLRVGDKVRIQVVKTDVPAGQIDFAFVETK